MNKYFFALKSMICDKEFRIDYLTEMGLYGWMSDEKYIKKKYKIKMGKELKLNPPITYNEKLQWIKLHDHNPLYTTLVDKYAVKNYVANLIGEKYIIPTLGVWDKFDDIEFEKLPDQFVLKCTHDSGGLVICKDKTKFNRDMAKKLIEKCLKRDFYQFGREWPYKNVAHRIIAEQYMEDSRFKELRDYKFFCFNGEVKALFVATERQKTGEDVKFDFFDSEFNHLEVKQGHENAILLPEKPNCFDEMKVLASKLSKGLREVRVDLYEVNGKIFFGELTFFHHGGWTPFFPEEWDYKFGEWIELSDKVF